MDNVLQIDKQILNSDKIICRHINNLCNSTRGEISQDILSQLRHFVEHILLKIYANGNDIEDTQDNVKQAVKYAKNQEWLRYLSRFHHFLQVSVSHRTLEEENSERLMLKYYEYLLRIKTMLHDKYSLDVLYNLEQFPIETDESLNEYYLKIVQKVDEYKESSKNMYKYDRFYIQNIKPFFCNNKIYYEVAFIPANDKASKTDRIIAFTDREITDFYAVKLAIEDDYIEIFDKCMPIRIILDWEVSIRPCEFKNFSKIINNQTKPIGKAEERELVKYLTESGRSLAEIVVYSDEKYNEIRNRIVPNREGYHFFDLLDFCRQLIKNQGAGYNVLRYLLHHMNNRVIKEQYHESYKKNYNTGRWEYLGANNWLSNLYLANECLPFDTMPFCSGLRKHVPNISDLLIALDTAGREHEFMARVIKNNTEQKGMLYTPLEQNGEKYKLGNFEDVETLKNIYNKKLPQTQKQQARKLIIDKGYIFIEAYRDDTISIITTIKRLAQSGVSNYSNTVKHWIENSDYNISEEKKKALETMFAKSHVSVIYGAAGTGKTTFINYISNFFKEYSKLYLAYTNPAVNNLKRKVAATSDCEFMTISKFNNRYNNDIKRKYDIIFIDECSTVSNKEMKEFLELADYKLLVLVGDTYQIESIEFGNWFDTIRGFLPESAICELIKPYRSNSKQLATEIKSYKKEGKQYQKDKEAVEARYKYDVRILNVLATTGLKASSIAHEMKNDRNAIYDNYNNIVDALKEYGMWDELNSSEKTRKSYKNVPYLLESNDVVGRKLVTFMDTMLEEIEKKQFEIRYQSIADILTIIKKVWERDYAWLSIEIIMDEDIVYQISEDILQVIFDNLILNSVQQNENTQKLMITISINETNGFLNIKYCDNGKGLDDKYKTDPMKILEVHETTRTNGHGLGMWIVNNTCTMSGGEIQKIGGEKGFEIEFTIGGKI